MSGNKIFGIIFMLFITTASAAILSTGCYDDNEARVTIHLERNDLAFQKELKQKRVIDKILEFFSTPAEAVTAPPWIETHGDLTLLIKSSSFETKSFSIPTPDVTYTVVVPAVNQVTFEVISISGVTKNWGAHTTIDLIPGDQDVNINMIPIPQINLLGGDIAWSDTSLSTNTQSYNLYRSNSSNGPYSLLINTVSNGYSYSPPSGTTYYKVSIMSTSGEEGVLSDYVFSTIP